LKLGNKTQTTPNKELAKMLLHHHEKGENDMRILNSS
jgi:hypothetical protein